MQHSYYVHIENTAKKRRQHISVIVFRNDIIWNGEIVVLCYPRQGGTIEREGSRPGSTGTDVLLFIFVSFRAVCE